MTERLRPEIMEQQLLLQETVIACLVGQLQLVSPGASEVRISQAELEMPPEIEEDEDPITGDWIYRVKGS